MWVERGTVATGKYEKEREDITKFMDRKNMTGLGAVLVQNLNPSPQHCTVCSLWSEMKPAVSYIICDWLNGMSYNIQCVVITECTIISLD